MYLECFIKLNLSEHFSIKFCNFLISKVELLFSKMIFIHKTYRKLNLVMCDHFSFNKMTIFINIAPIENFGPLQTLFLSLKIAIFSRIVPRAKSENRQTLANFTSIKQRFSARSPPGILCVDEIPISAPRVSLCR